MKILLSHRYYWPDTTPYASMLRSIAESLVNNGHEVHVFCSIPSYREKINVKYKEHKNGVSIQRSWVFQENKTNSVVRLLNVFLYSLSLFFRIISLKPDIVSASTFPPVIIAWVTSIAAKLTGAKFIYHMQDIHPEVSNFSGGFLGKKIPSKLLLFLDNQSLKRASAIVVLSQDMADTLAKRNIGDLPIHIINNFLLEDFSDNKNKNTPSEFKKAKNKTRVIFAGNLGKFQNLPLLTEGIAACFDNFPELELLFLGDGIALAELKAKWHGHSQIKFAPFLPFAQAQELIAEADLGLVSLSPNIYRVAFPSKVLTYLGLGLPVFAIVEQESNLAQEIIDNKIGFIPQSMNIGSIEKEIVSFLKGPNLRDNVNKYYTEQLRPSTIFLKWEALIKGIEDV